MMKLTILRGASASGKSTWAENQRGLVVSRDKIRMSLFGSESMDHENMVTVVEDATIAAALKDGFNVIVDDTNTRWKYVKRLAQIGVDAGAEVEVKVFDVPLDECIRRNRHRAVCGGRNVPIDVIKRQHQALKSSKNMVLEPLIVKPYEVPPVFDTFLCDIDGTLAKMNGRGPYDWDRVGEDAVNASVATVVSALYRNGYNIVLLSGRDSVARAGTEKWLKAGHIEYTNLFMRAEGDMRPDDVVKHELFNDHIRGIYDVGGVFDDRASVCALWHKMGIPVFNVAGLDGGKF